MSRFGRTPILLPEKVEVKIEGGMIVAKGPKGTLSLTPHAGISVRLDGQRLLVERDEAVAMPKTTHGLHRALINNLVQGVGKGFEVKLGLVGVGYRAAVQGQLLDLQLGFSHPTQLPIPKGLQVTVDKSVTIVISGIDKHLVGQFAAQVRGMKPPEPYKGKGIRYEGEYVRKKDGKAAKGKTA